MLQNITYGNGVYIANNWLDNITKDKMKDFVLSKTKEINKTNYRLYENSLKNTEFEKKEFINLIDKFCKEIVKETKLNVNIKKCYKVLRVIGGEGSNKQSHLYHFDAHKLTILVPLVIPNNYSEKNGDLIIIPNLRKLHNNIILNIIQKIFFQNKIIAYFIKNNFLFKKYKIKIKPGNLYAFFGFTTLHGNEDIEKNSTRATLLLHFDDVFSNSKLVEINRSLYQKKEIKNLGNITK